MISLRKIFIIKSLSEFSFVMALVILTAALILSQAILFQKRYHRIQLDIDTKSELFIEKIGEKTLIVYKEQDKESGYPYIIYSIFTKDKQISQGRMILGENELYPSEIIFFEQNNTIHYLDQYKRYKEPEGL